MSLRTGFHVTKALLAKRLALHKLADPLWKSGAASRASIYAYMKQRIGCPDVPHISDLQEDQLDMLIKEFLCLWEKNGIVKCSGCRHSGEKDQTGLPTCKKCGDPFLKYSEKDSPALVKCSAYIERK